MSARSPIDSVVATTRGDDGTTGLLYGGERIGKDDARAEAYGTVDEAIAALGMARANLGLKKRYGTLGPSLGGLAPLILRIQRELFVVGAELATAPENRAKLTAGTTLVTREMVDALEPLIDEITGRFDPPTEFALPGENRVAAALDLARTIVRRAERESVTAAREGWVPADSAVIPYLNRLADLCWTLARWQEGEYRPARGDR